MLIDCLGRLETRAEWELLNLNLFTYEMNEGLLRMCKIIQMLSRSFRFVWSTRCTKQVLWGSREGPGSTQLLTPKWRRRRKCLLGTPINFYGARPRFAWRCEPPKPAESSLSLWLKELGQSPHSGHSGYCACDAYLQRQRRPTCVARSCQPAAFRYAALCQFLSNTNARADESETKQNKTKAGTVGYGLVKVSLAWVLFIYAHVLCRPSVPYPLLVTCTVFCLPTITHTYSRRITHTHRTPPASSSSPLERPLINAACLGIKG